MRKIIKIVIPLVILVILLISIFVTRDKTSNIESGQLNEKLTEVYELRVVQQEEPTQLGVKKSLAVDVVNKENGEVTTIFSSEIQSQYAPNKTFINTPHYSVAFSETDKIMMIGEYATKDGNPESSALGGVRQFEIDLKPIIEPSFFCNDTIECSPGLNESHLKAYAKGIALLGTKTVLVSLGEKDNRKVWVIEEPSSKWECFQGESKYVFIDVETLESFGVISENRNNPCP